MKLLFITLLIVVNVANAQSDSSLRRIDDLPEKWQNWAVTTVSDHLYRAGKLQAGAFWYATGGGALTSLGIGLYVVQDRSGLGIACMVGGGALVITSIVHRQMAFAHLQIAAIKISRKQGISFHLSPMPTGLSLRASLTNLHRQKPRQTDK